MPGKSKIETPPPSMNDVIRNRAYEMWGVRPEPAAKPKSAKKATKTAAKSKKSAKKH